MGTLFSGIRPDTIGILMLVSPHIALFMASCALDFPFGTHLGTNGGPNVAIFAPNRQHGEVYLFGFI